MQTFLPHPNFAASAHVLDRQRLGKQRVENLQIMSALLGLKLGKTRELRVTGSQAFYYDEEGFEVDELNLEADRNYNRVMEPVRNWFDIPSSDWEVIPNENQGWVNHPVTRMWRGYEWQLLKYQQAIVKEWTKRGYKDTCFLKTFTLYFHDRDVIGSNEMPPWFGDKAFHLAHKSNLIRKDPEYYKQWFPGVPDNLPYIYPVSKE